MQKSRTRKKGRRIFRIERLRRRGRGMTRRKKGKGRKKKRGMWMTRSPKK